MIKKVIKTNYTTLVHNISNYCYHNGIKIEDIDKEFGLSDGYIVDCLYDSDKQLSIDVVCGIALKIGVSIDTLLTKELYRLEVKAVPTDAWDNDKDIIFAKPMKFDGDPFKEVDLPWQ